MARRPSSRRRARLDAAVTRLDDVLARRGNAGARSALLALQVAPADPAALARLRVAVLAEPGEPEPAEPDEGPRARTRAKMALASGLSVTLALVSGQLLFGAHWPWTVITVIAVSLSARSRGEVLVRSGQRLLGALAAAALVSPLAAVLAPYPGAVILALLTILAFGWYLRDASRIWWAAAMTATLALLAALADPGASPWLLLGTRLAAIGVGGVCAIGPALALAPRSRDVLRRRVGRCLRRLRACVDDPTVATLRHFDAALAELDDAGRPLRVLRRRAPELGWYTSLADAAPDLRTSVAAGEPAPPTIRRLLRDVADEVRQVA
jgi:hypothetical protein